jgi:hypothetical protein
MIPGTTSRRRADSAGLTVEVALTFWKRGGRKQIIMPKEGCAPARTLHESFTTSSSVSVLRALARAHRWKAMLESGSYSSITELAAAEKVNRSYLCRTLRLTLLSPELTTTLLSERGPHLCLEDVMRPFANEWTAQLKSVSSKRSVRR